MLSFVGVVVGGGGGGAYHSEFQLLSQWIALSLYTFATASTRQQPPGTEKRHVNNPKEALELPPLSLDRPHSERGNVTPQKGIFTQKRHDMPNVLRSCTLYGLFHS